MHECDPSPRTALLMLGQSATPCPPADLPPLRHLCVRPWAALNQHVRESSTAPGKKKKKKPGKLQNAQQQLLEQRTDRLRSQIPGTRNPAQRSGHAEQASTASRRALELPRLLMLAIRRTIRRGAPRSAGRAGTTRVFDQSPRWRDGGLAPDPAAPHRPRHPAAGCCRPLSFGHASGGGLQLKRWSSGQLRYSDDQGRG